jgi:predicted flavoprotein YhiN
VAVVGGGAAGLMAALAAAEAGAEVTVLERGDRVGRKLLATGNGRCNLTNLWATPEHYHGGGAALAASALGLAPPAVVLSAFEALGLHWREEAEGRVYPLSGQAAAVLDVLRLGCARRCVALRCGQAVRRVTRDGSGFSLALEGGEAVRADRVVAATGGMAGPRFGSDGSGYALLAALGHQITPRYPALAQLRCAHPGLRALKGLRVRAEVALLTVDRDEHTERAARAGNAEPVERTGRDERTERVERGEVLFADYGLSGIAILGLARWAGAALAEGRALEASLRLLPDHDASARRALVDGRRALFAEVPAGRLFTGLLPRPVSEALCGAAAVPPDQLCGRLTDAQIGALAGLLGDWRFPVTGTQGFDSAQVTAGGVDARAFDPATMGSLLVPGLYAVGELLDVDGDCGGFNLQFAWASGLLAGRSAGLPSPPQTRAICEPAYPDHSTSAPFSKRATPVSKKESGKFCTPSSFWRIFWSLVKSAVRSAAPISS